MSWSSLRHQVRRHFQASLAEFSFLYPLSIFVLSATQSLVLLGLYSTHSAENLLDHWGAQIQLSVEFKPDATPDSIQRTKDEIHRHPEVEKVHFISQQEAREKFAHAVKGYLPELAQDASLQSFLSSSLQVTLNSKTNLAERLPALAQLWSAQPAVAHVSHSEDWLKAYSTLGRSFQSFGIFLLILLLVAGGFSLVTVLRHGLDLRKQDLEILELLGATPLQVRFPFFLEAFLILGMSTLLSSGLVGVCIYFVENSELLAALGVAKTTPSTFFVLGSVQVALILLALLLVAWVLKSQNSGWALKNKNLPLTRALSWIFLGAFAAGSFAPVGARASSGSAAGNSLGAPKDFDQARQRWLDNEKRSRDIMATLFASQKDMKKLVEEKGALRQEIQKTEMAVKDIAKEILVLKDQVAQKRTELQSRVRLFQKWSAGGAIQFLFNSESSADLYQRLKLLSFLTKKDLELAKDYLASQKELESKNQKFLVRVEELKSLQKSIQAKEKSLAQEQEIKKERLAALKEANSHNLAKLQELRQSGLIDPLVSPSLVEQKGKLPWPVEQTPLYERFRILRDDTYQVVLPHKGWFFATEQSRPVQSIFSGVVQFVGSLGELGNLIILDHGDHFYSVYAGLQDIVVKPGQFIQERSKLARTGNFPLRRNQGLYFEVRHFSEPEDPQQWLTEASL